MRDKPTGGKKKNKSGTADTMARRAGERGVSSKNTGTRTGMPHHIDRTNTTPHVYYRTTGSSNKSINNGKRFASDKEMKGSNRLKMDDAATGKTVEVWGEYNKKIKASDAIVKPTVKKKAAVKKGSTPRPKKK